jgi:hypothetical protein
MNYAFLGEGRIDRPVLLKILDGLRAVVFEDMELFRLEVFDGIAFGIRDCDVLKDELDSRSDGENAFGTLK